MAGVSAFFSSHAGRLPLSLRAVSDSDDALRGQLSAFDLGPAWARSESTPASGKRGPRRESKGGDDRRGEDRRSDKRPPFKKTFRDERREERRVEPEIVGPAAGVRVQLQPDAAALHLVAKEIHHVARVYSLFDVAKLMLDKRERCRATFDIEAAQGPMLLGADGSLFLTREEALRHFWQSDARNEWIEEETIEVDPPAGNFQSVARCGLSGVYLGPPNFHTYQATLRRLHREQFSHLPFEVYSSKVRTERGEEAVNAWLETMKQRTHWRVKGDENWIEDKIEIERQVATRVIESAFKAVHQAEISGGVAQSAISPALYVSLREAGLHVRQHPALLIPALCRMLEAEHLPVFKRDKKLFTGPARPHPLPHDAVLAERPAAIVAWLRTQSPEKPPTLKHMWKAVLGADEEASPEWLADLFWLLTQGHVQLFANDRIALVVRRIQGGAAEPVVAAIAADSEDAAPKTAKKRKRKRRNKSFLSLKQPKLRVCIERVKLREVQFRRQQNRSWQLRLIQRAKRRAAELED